MTHDANISKFHSHCPSPSSELKDNSLSRWTHCVTLAHQTSSRQVKMKHDSVSLPECQAIKAWKYGRKTPLTKFVVITMVLVRFLFSTVRCHVDWWTAYRPACWLYPLGIYTVSYPRRLESFKTNHLYSWQQNEVTASCCLL